MTTKKPNERVRLVRVETRLAEKTPNHPDGPYMTIVEHHRGVSPNDVGFEETIRSKTPGITMAQLARARRKAVANMDRACKRL